MTLLLAMCITGACAADAVQPSPSEQDGVGTQSGVTPTDRSGKEFLLPYDVSRLPTAEQNQYLEGLGDAELAELVESGRIASFVKATLSEQRRNELGKLFPELNVLTPQNVAPYLTLEERAELESYSPPARPADALKGDSDAVFKECGGWRYSGRTTSCNALLGFCQHCDLYTRDCEWHDIFSAVRKNENCTTEYYL
jgi:hypothetical protein